MKKSSVLSMTLAALCAAGTASALDTTRPLGTTWILGTRTRLSSAGGLLAAGPQAGGYCTYQMEWLDPKDPSNLGVCKLREMRPFGTACADASLKDIDTFVESDPVAVCTGFNAAGAAVPTKLSLVELSSGGAVRLQGVAVQGMAVYPIVIKAALQGVERKP